MADPAHGGVAVLGFHDGSAGQVAEWFEAVTGLRIACFVIDADEAPTIDEAAENAKRVTQRLEYPRAGSFKGRPLVARRDWVDELRRRGATRVLPLTPDNRERARHLEVCRSAGFELVSAIHPSVRVLEGATVEAGVWANAGAIIGYRAEVRAGVLINTGVQIDHHNVLEECCQLDPGVVTAGNVTLRRRSHVHTGATIINRIEIGEDSIVGAGAVVIDDIPPRSTAVGVPARVIKRSAP